MSNRAIMQKPPFLCTGGPPHTYFLPLSITEFSCYEGNNVFSYMTGHLVDIIMMYG